MEKKETKKAEIEREKEEEKTKEIEEEEKLSKLPDWLKALKMQKKPRNGGTLEEEETSGTMQTGSSTPGSSASNPRLVVTNDAPTPQVNDQMAQYGSEGEDSGGDKNIGRNIAGKEDKGCTSVTPNQHFDESECAL